MPVFAEQKEPSTALQVDSPMTATDTVHNLKQSEAVPVLPETLTASPSSSSIADTTDVESSCDDASSSAPASPASSIASLPSSPSSLAGLAEPEKQTVIIFDWDDTLLASSFLSSHGYRLDTNMAEKENYEFIRNELAQLETCVVNIVSEALTRGTVHIVTNAESGWVELSAQKFIPGVLPLLSKVQIISARSTFESKFPDFPYKWKFCAMHEKLAPVLSLSDTKKNIISFGDSHVEREAIRAVTRGCSDTFTKSIKFAECPSAEQLRKQLELVSNCFNYIFSHDGDLDLMLKMSVATATA